MSEKQIKKNLSRSAIIGPFVVISTALLNFVLFGILARKGGLNVIGDWVKLQSCVALVVCADLGLAAGIARRVAAESSDIAFPLLNRLTVSIVPILVITTIFGITFAMNGMLWYAALIFCIAGGFTQLLSQWWSALQIGSHRHHYSFIADFLLNVSQFSILGIFIAILDASASQYFLIFGATLFISRIIHFIIVIIGLSVSPIGIDALVYRRDKANWGDVAETASPFLAFSVVSKLREPVINLVIGAIAGGSALGAFAVARRIPTLILTIASSGLMALLPGYVGLEKNPQARVFLTTDALLGQFFVTYPMLIFYIAFSDVILLLWMGSSDTIIIIMTTIFCVSVFFQTTFLPFYWTLQAVNQAKWQAKILGVDLFISIIFICITIFLFESNAFSIILCIIVSTSTIIKSLLNAIRSQNYTGIVKDSFYLLPWFSIIFVTFAYIMISILSLNFPRSVQMGSLGDIFGIAVFVILSTPIFIYSLRLRKINARL